MAADRKGRAEVTSKGQRLWSAIHRYVVACGGDPSVRVYGNVARQQAVADIEAEALADREHLLEGARILADSYKLGLLLNTAYGAALDRWLAAERARKARDVLDEKRALVERVRELEARVLEYEAMVAT